MRDKTSTTINNSHGRCVEQISTSCNVLTAFNRPMHTFGTKVHFLTTMYIHKGQP